MTFVAVGIGPAFIDGGMNGGLELFSYITMAFDALVFESGRLFVFAGDFMSAVTCYTAGSAGFAGDWMAAMQTNIVACVGHRAAAIGRVQTIVALGTGLVDSALGNGRSRILGTKNVVSPVAGRAFEFALVGAMRDVRCRSTVTGSTTDRFELFGVGKVLKIS